MLYRELMFLTTGGGNCKKNIRYKNRISGIATWIKVQDAVYVRGVTKTAKLKFLTGKLLNILYFELQNFAVRKMIQ
jgi:hypothetical protein